MTTGIVIKGKWGLSDRVLRKMLSVRNRCIEPPFDSDAPQHALWGADLWHNYPVKNYVYKFNKYGFRGEDYELYQDQAINIAIGDCNTLGIGVPIEHTWPYQLSELLNEPVLNYAVNGLSYFDYAEVVEKTRREMHQVRRVFVMYGLANVEGPASRVVYEWSQLPITQRIEQLKKHCWLHGAYYVFNPAWQWPTEELSELYRHFPDAHAYMQDAIFERREVDIDLLLRIVDLRQKYKELSGRFWPDYEQVIMTWYSGRNIMHLFDQPIDQKLISVWLRDYLQVWATRLMFRGRDGWHPGQYLNSKIANYFFQKSKAGNAPD